MRERWLHAMTFGLGALTAGLIGYASWQILVPRELAPIAAPPVIVVSPPARHAAFDADAVVKSSPRLAPDDAPARDESMSSLHDMGDDVAKRGSEDIERRSFGAAAPETPMGGPLVMTALLSPPSSVESMETPARLATVSPRAVAVEARVRERETGSEVKLEEEANLNPPATSSVQARKPRARALRQQRARHAAIRPARRANLRRARRSASTRDFDRGRSGIRVWRPARWRVSNDPAIPPDALIIVVDPY